MTLLSARTVSFRDMAAAERGGGNARAHTCSKSQRKIISQRARER